MKLFVVAAVLGVCLADRLDNKYLPPRGNAGAGVGAPGFGGFGAKAAGGFGNAGAGFGHGGGGNFAPTQYTGNTFNAPPSAYNPGAYNAPQNYNSRPQDANAQTLRQNQEVNTDSFSYDFETSNGIRADAQGVATNGVQSQGSFGYKGDDGQDYSITYTADENGYRPQGAHLPTSPPIPEEILKSLEQNARDEAAGIVDDGSYHGEGAGAGGYSGAGGHSGAGGYSGAGGHSGAGGYSGAGGHSGAGGYGGAGGHSGAGHSAAGYSAPRPSGGFGGRAPTNFGGAPSRQYLTPKAGPRGTGNGNFNPQSGYQY